SSKASRLKPASSLHRSTDGSPRALTPLTCRRPRRCWRRWHNATPADTPLLDNRRNNTMAQPTPAQRMEHAIRTYIQACNDADAAAIAASFCPEAVHYFPAPHLKCSGAATIGSHFARRVRELGICWTVDQLITDVDRCAATLEWTEFIRRPVQ